MSGMPVIRAFVVDDHPIVRRGLKHILDEAPDVRVVEEASSGAELFEKLGRTACDLLILDISLPDRSGLEVLKEVRRLHPRLPVLVFSMYAEDLFAIRALRAGAAGYVAKDSVPEELLKAVRRAGTGGKYVSAALAEKLATEIGRGERVAHERLSDREYEVMCLLARGKRVSTIASDLALSVKTVSTYRVRVLEKLGVKTTADVTRYALKHGLVD
jgi:DNA-binding NarL/FixJ family response regulator